jgi:hypothetical protein
VNGLGQSLASLARSAGPALGGVLWSVSTKHHAVFVNFLVVCVLLCVGLYINNVIPRSLDFKKQPRKANRSKTRKESPASPESDVSAGAETSGAIIEMH